MQTLLFPPGFNNGGALDAVGWAGVTDRSCARNGSTRHCDTAPSWRCFGTGLRKGKINNSNYSNPPVCAAARDKRKLFFFFFSFKLLFPARGAAFGNVQERKFLENNKIVIK